MTERDPFDAELEELRGSKAALQTEIERLRKLNDDQQAEMLTWHMQLSAKDEVIRRQQKIIDGTERRESEYLALIEKHATENEARRVQWEEAKREAEKWVHESGVRLGQAHKVLQERNDEVARLRVYTTRLLSENERLKAERHTTKRMLEDILDKHGVERPGRP